MKSTVTVHQHPVLGKVIFGNDLRNMIPELKNQTMRPTPYISDKCMAIFTDEEMKAAGIRYQGNPRLGKRVFTEEGCHALISHSESVDKEKARVLISSVFHVDEANDSSASKAGDGELVGMIQMLMEQVSAQTEMLNDMQGRLIRMEEENQKFRKELKKSRKHSDDDVESVASSDYGAYPISILVAAKSVRSAHKKSVNEMIRKMDSPERTYRQTVLAGVPKRKERGVLKEAYKYMLKEYGIPLGSYKGEYFDETSVCTSDNLDIAEWLEYKNPSTKGLLRCCVESVYPECAI